MQQREQAAAVDARHGRAAQRREGRRQVDVGHEAVLDAGHAAHGVEPGDERDPQDVLVRRPLAHHPVLTARVALVGGEHDQRVGQAPGVPQGIEDVGHRLVDRQERLADPPARGVGCPDLVGGERRCRADVGRLVGHVGLVEVGAVLDRHAVEHAPMARRRLLTTVGPEGREHEEEGLGGRRAADEALGVGDQDVGRVVGRRAAVGLPLAVVVELVVVVGAAGVVAEPPERMPVVPTGRRALPDPAVPVLPDEPGAVAGGIEGGGDRGAVVERPGPVAVLPVGEHAAAVGVPTGQERRPGRAADGVHDEGVGEGRASAHELLADGRHHREVVESLVVGEDHHDVRAAGRGLDRRGIDGRAGGGRCRHEGRRQGRQPGQARDQAALVHSRSLPPVAPARNAATDVGRLNSTGP